MDLSMKCKVPIYIATAALAYVAGSKTHRYFKKNSKLPPTSSDLYVNAGIGCISAALATKTIDTLLLTSHCCDKA